jgi:hypothetical protein
MRYASPLNLNNGVVDSAMQISMVTQNARRPAQSNAPAAARALFYLIE